MKLGGVLTTVAFGILTFGGFMSALFVSNSEAVTWFRFATELGSVEGTVLSSDRTNMRHNSSTIDAVHYEYRVDGTDFRGTSYCQGVGPSEGERVFVHYAVDDPSTSYVQGMRSAPFPLVTGVILLFPLAAVGLLMYGMHRGKKRLALMERGTSAWGLLVDHQPTNTRINNQQVHKLTFAFVDADGEKRTATDRSHRREFFDDQVARHVLVAGDDSCIVELLPGKPQIANEQWAPVSGFELWRVFILPIVAVVVILAASQITI